MQVCCFFNCPCAVTYLPRCKTLSPFLQKQIMLLGMLLRYSSSDVKQDQTPEDEGKARTMRLRPEERGQDQLFKAEAKTKVKTKVKGRTRL